MNKTWLRVGWAPLILALGIQTVLVVSVQAVEYDEAIFLDVARNICRSGLPLRSIGEAGRYYLEHTPLYPYTLGAMSC